MNGSDGDLRRRAAALRPLAEETGPDGLPAGAVLAAALRVFESEGALALAVHQRRQATLLARLDQVLEQGGDDPHEAVLLVVEQLSRELPGFAAILHAH